LKAEFQKKICLLVSEISDLSSQPTEDAKEKVRVLVQDIRNEKHKYDIGTDVLEELEKTINKVEENLNEKGKIVALTKNLEKTRNFKKWGWAGPV
jgi:phenylpyruvate tautomerase PptA (4-oxalocrotonate tautomerase family)